MSVEASVDWLVSIAPYDCPPSVVERAEHHGRLGRLLRLWEVNLGPLSIDPDGDPEDFIEQAARLDAAVVGFGAPHIWVHTDSQTARHLATHEKRPVTELAHLPRYGAQSTPRALHHLTPPDPADLYFTTDTFRRHAGREVHACTVQDGPTGLHALALDMAVRGHRRLFVKATEAKYGVFDITIDAAAGPFVTRDDLDAALRTAIAHSELGWAGVYFEGVPNAFLLQQHVVMSCEYRLFVVGHQVVTGAGCVEHHTPIDNEAPFDPKVEIRRGCGEVVHRPEVVDRLVDFGRRVATEMQAERQQMSQYTLDVALGPDAEPLVIELNGLLNSGLYASDTRRTTTAMRELRERSGTV